MWRSIAAVAVSMILMGCGGDPFVVGSAPDAGGDADPSTEAGEDSGSPSEASEDSGLTAHQDSGTDSGSMNQDSGTTDSGTSMQDSGTVVADSGQMTDSGTQQDSGSMGQDSGTGCSTGETMCNGSCQPGVCVLVSGLSQAAVGLAVNSEVYWSDFTTSAVNTVALDGASNPSTVTTAYVPNYFAATKTNAVWTDEKHIVSTTPAGVSTVLYSLGQTIPAVAVDTQNLYWVDSQAGTVSQMALGTSTPIPLAVGQNMPSAIAVDATTVYWANAGDGSVMKAAIGGGTGPQTIATGKESWVAGSRISGIAVDATGVYWTTTVAVTGTVTKCLLTGCGTSPIWQVPSQDNAWNIVTDGTNVYWTNPGHNGGNGSVVSIPATGGSLTTIASGLKNPYGIALDATSVYWADATSISKHALL